MKNGTTDKPIMIVGKKRSLPFSKGMLAGSIMATGLAPAKSYRIAQQIDDALRDKGLFEISIPDLDAMVTDLLTKFYGEDFASNYSHWRRLGKLDKPVILMVGGTTGVGKSTIAAELAHRLGIVRIGSTDSIREVMRSQFSKELMPALYGSSFTAWKLLRFPLPKSADPVIVGFTEQCELVTIGVEAIIERAINEGVNMVVEGAHLLPGFIKPEYRERAFIVELVVAVNDEEQHRTHFYVREMEGAKNRPSDKYVENFDNIRKIQNYIKKLAKRHDVPVFGSDNLDQTVAKILRYVLKDIFGSRDTVAKTS
jgi:2-phosphoglycerate kinase